MSFTFHYVQVVGLAQVVQGILVLLSVQNIRILAFSSCKLKKKKTEVLEYKNGFLFHSRIKMPKRELFQRNSTHSRKDFVWRKCSEYLISAII